MTPPIKFPTKISGVPFATAWRPTENSGVEVRSPKSKKDTAKDESLSFSENLLVEETINPDPIQIKKNANTKSAKLIAITNLV